ncbi:BrnA antitoxin family protein [Treponema sp. HNW]|uniref:BrnA antitoxin family protein n=1 Tax=Treponema sp. HNW TaxID=3116654 RepID=UPI003D10F7AC
MEELKNFIARCEANAVPDEQIDTSDIPELTEGDFERGYFKYRKPMKRAVMFRIDIDNLKWLQSVGKKDYQTRLNNALRWARQNGCPLI